MFYKAKEAGSRVGEKRQKQVEIIQEEPRRTISFKWRYTKTMSFHVTDYGSVVTVAFVWNFC